MTGDDTPPLDLFVIGGGINGVGIARDAAGRGLSVALAEKGDLGAATSSASSKLIHGGLRYLEFFEVGLVGKALKEREILLASMPHISWPMRFVLPYHAQMRFDSDTPTGRLLGRFMPWLRGRRPAWLIRLGLFLYDRLGGGQSLPGTVSVDLRRDAAGAPLQARFTRGFEYSDGWVQDARLVVLAARDAQARGAEILTRTEVLRAERQGGLWQIALRDVLSGATRQVRAKALVNAAGPWVSQVNAEVLRVKATERVRLVRGSHIVTRRLFDHDRAYFLQGSDGRIVFALPFEEAFTLIGTTDQPHPGPEAPPVCSADERAYLCDFVSTYFRQPVTARDVVWQFSGVRPLYDDGAASATAATRDYVLTLDAPEAAPLLTVYGGKITTYRLLAEEALARLAPFWDHAGGAWTAGAALPGGDFPMGGAADLIADLRARFGFLDAGWARRLVRSYGTEAALILGAAQSAADLGESFGATLTEAELGWLMDREFAVRAEDVVWRRSKLGLRMTQPEIARLDRWMQRRRAQQTGEGRP